MPSFRALLLVLVIGLGLFPAMALHALLAGVIGLALILALIGAVIAARPGTPVVVLAVVLGAATQVLLLLEPESPIQAARSLTSAGFFAVGALALVAAVWREREVTADTLLGGIAIYLLIGLVFALLYSAIEVTAPGSFRAPPEVSLDLQGDRAPALVYFSYVTLTTLGYGDVTPTSVLTRQLTSLEAIVGQLYIAILIARVLAMLVTQQLRGRT